jgi:hypothetical protein
MVLVVMANNLRQMVEMGTQRMGEGSQEDPGGLVSSVEATFVSRRR